MEELIYFNELYDLYGILLTDKQKQYFEDYYFNNLSLGEMAENYGISRNAIFKQIHIVTEKLKMYEKKLKFNEKIKKLNKVIEELEDEVKEIIEAIF